MNIGAATQVPARPALPRRLLERTAPVRPRRSEQAGRDVEADRARWLLCTACRAPITSPGDAIEVNGRHDHTFTNPHGLVFRVGCFRRAPGCSAFGEATSAWTWFRGFRWRIAVCARCGQHLGWAYQGPLQTAFHGLILPRLKREP